MTVMLAQKKPVKLRVLYYDGSGEASKAVLAFCPPTDIPALNPGDWVIEGLRGEFYAMPNEEFQLHFDLLGANPNDAG